MDQKPPVQPGQKFGLLVIASFKAFKAVLLVIAAAGAFSLLHRDVAAVASRLTDLLRVDFRNHYLHLLLSRLGNVQKHTLEEFGVGSLVYAALFATESVGLFLRRRWAELLTVIMTASFVPLELLQLVRRPTPGKGVVLIANLLIVGYLLVQLRKDAPSRR